VQWGNWACYYREVVFVAQPLDEAAIRLPTGNARANRRELVNNDVRASDHSDVVEEKARTLSALRFVMNNPNCILIRSQSLAVRRVKVSGFANKIHICWIRQATDGSNELEFSPYDVSECREWRFRLAMPADIPTRAKLDFSCVVPVLFPRVQHRTNLPNEASVDI